METVLDLLLLRFALIAAGLVVLALVAFGVALAMRRRGISLIDQVAPVAEALLARWLERRR
ncbi:hypothetical protein Val02_12300 [Virgisporangium aliadipatigenens]|uniref:Uncharacterized protein n=1 Tax=Virgisporangium aliadipatigenens TaxID=741659 RepID=A0A8J3YFR1_9ACTN|nr:hypothetical protein [Virgisporangium aliadipatigenens]GIJ44344.1 hypothetical protein Val02_12300 [Virgisporangium aliadipatigenens]